MNFPCRRGGFSLIELLVSMTIGAILLLAAAAMLGHAGNTYERVSGALAGEREARTLISQLAADLSTARFHKDGVFDQSTANWPADRLGFLCLQPAQAQSDAGRLGDLCAVNYHLADLSIGGKTTRCLMRGCRESIDTFKALAENGVRPLLTGTCPADEPVAFGVVSFEARPKSRDPAGQWVDWVPDDRRGPEAIDVRLVLARRDLAAKLQRPQDWDGAGSAGWLSGRPAAVLRNANLEVYAALIHFGNHENPPASTP